MSVDELKQQAAERALELVSSGSIIGLGTGSTARFVVAGLAQRLVDGRLHDIAAVPTSQATADQATGLGIRLLSLDEASELALTIDGADQIDPQLNLVKGLGGALLREKIVAASSARLIIVADESKLVGQLGSRTALPVEIVPFARALCSRRLAALGLTPALRLGGDGSPFLTDEGNYILDCASGPIADLAALDQAILAIPGVVDHGMFLGMASLALVASSSGVVSYESMNAS